MTIEIRPLVSSDHAAWLPLWQGYLTFYKTSLPEEQTERTWSRFLDANFNLHALGAFDDGVLVGIVHYNFQNSTWSNQGFVLLEDLFVDSEIRGKGIGRSLIEAVKAIAEKHGCSRLYWNTDHFNETARKLYDTYVLESGKVQYRVPLT
jgi:GNAT superfamily N-acetyltransferase